MDKEPLQENNNDDIQESNRARLLRVRYKEEENTEEKIIEGGFWENFWYHHKWKVIIIGLFIVIALTLAVQIMNKTNIDIYILYAGPDYITVNQNRKFCNIVEEVMDDYDGNGEKKVILNDMVFMSEAQAKEVESEALARDEDVYIDKVNHAQVNQQFNYEIMAGDTLLCIMSEDQYELVLAGGGFTPLSEIFDTVPDGAADEYGIRFSETKFCKFYSDAQIFPEDSIIALRRISTMNQLKSKKRMEVLLEHHKELLRKIILFEYPEGYVPTEE